MQTRRIGSQNSGRKIQSQDVYARYLFRRVSRLLCLYAMLSRTCLINFILRVSIEA